MEKLESTYRLKFRESFANIRLIEKQTPISLLRSVRLPAKKKKREGFFFWLPSPPEFEKVAKPPVFNII